MEIANKKAIDIFGAVLDICVRRYKRNGYVTEADMKLFLKGLSILSIKCGFTLTKAHAREVLNILESDRSMTG